MLSELVPAESCQGDLFSAGRLDVKSAKLMHAMDQINRAMGRHRLKLGSEGFRQPWKMKQGNKSPCYTTRWLEIAVVT
jgi:DNA polymerase V